MSELLTPSLRLPGRFHLLLQSAFHTDAQTARAAWEQWEREVDFDDIAYAEMRILPFVSKRLRELQVQAENEPRIRGIRQMLWVRSMAVIDAARPVLQQLASVRIPLLVLKGADRVLSSPDHPSERCISDVDVLVPRQNVADAVYILHFSGWRTEGHAPPKVVLRRLHSSSHSAGYAKNPPFEIDLHASALLLNRCPDHDDGLWARARPIGSETYELLGASPADRLVIACGHGPLHSPTGSVDWVADAIDALRDERFDWDIFEGEIRHRDLAAFADAGLTYLSEGLGHAIPQGVRERTRANLTPELIAEFEGHAAHVEPESAAERRAWGAAALKRAQHWSEREREGAAGDGGRSGSSSLQSHTIRSKKNADGDIVVSVPQALRTRRGKAMLEISVSVNPFAARLPDAVALVCFSHHVVELERKPVPESDRSRWRFRRLRLCFAVECAFLDAYRLDEMRVEFLCGDTLERADEAVRSVSFRWQAPA